MKNTIPEIQEYLEAIPAERKEAFQKLREIIQDNTRQLSEEISYGMIGYVVPHKLYPAGYHCDPKQPLPFMGFASQKNFVSF